MATDHKAVSLRKPLGYTFCGMGSWVLVASLIRGSTNANTPSGLFLSQGLSLPLKGGVLTLID